MYTCTVDTVGTVTGVLYMNDCTVYTCTVYTVCTDFYEGGGGLQPSKMTIL